MCTGQATPEAIALLAKKYTAPKRGRPRKPKKPKPEHSNRTAENLELHYRVMAIWVQLRHADIGKMQRRKMIADVCNRAPSVIDKILAKMNKLIDLGYLVPYYDKANSTVFLLHADEFIELLHFYELRCYQVGQAIAEVDTQDWLNENCLQRDFKTLSKKDIKTFI